MQARLLFISCRKVWCDCGISERSSPTSKWNHFRSCEAQKLNKSIHLIFALLPGHFYQLFIGAYHRRTHLIAFAEWRVESNILIRICAITKMHCYLTFLWTVNISKCSSITNLSQSSRIPQIIVKLLMHIYLPSFSRSRPTSSRHWSTYKSTNINKDHKNHMEKKPTDPKI